MRNNEEKIVLVATHRIISICFAIAIASAALRNVSTGSPYAWCLRVFFQFTVES